MKILTSFFCILIAAVTAGAQVEFVSGSYFPADQEFQELQQVTSRITFEDPEQLREEVEDGRLMADVGFQKYARRVYALQDSGTLSIEIVTLLDFRAAYSLLTLLRASSVETGPPGDGYSKLPDGIVFAHERAWVRIRGRNVPGDLPMRVAASISNRMGRHEPKRPSLISRLPLRSLDAASLHYYPNQKSFASVHGEIAGRAPEPDLDFEIAQAQWPAEGGTGKLSLISFPTPEVADDYYAGIGDSAGESERIYAKKTGTLVAVLEGSFNPEDAQKVLNSIEFTYSVRWIYEKEEKPKTVWGIPGGILATVVKSIVAVVILGGFSVLVGIAIAFLRVMLRGRREKRLPDGSDPNEITHLKLR
mgnify:FL=1